MKATFLKNLSSKLREFGLDPRDWHLEMIEENARAQRIRIAPRDGDGPSLIGWAKRGYWIELAVQG